MGAEALTGKDNKKARTEKSKEASAMKNDPKYIDACKVVKGLPAPNGNFMTKTDASAPAAAEAPKEEVKEEKKAEKKDDKPKKKMESAGLGPDEKKDEEYRLQLKSEFQYSDKDIKADPDMQDMMKQ